MLLADEPREDSSTVIAPGDGFQRPLAIAYRLLCGAGASERTIQKFVIAQAKRAASSDALAAALRAGGFPEGSKTSEFATQLLARVPKPQVTRVCSTEFCSSAAEMS
jgi:hypothetical protein